jgi:hypothetical protein
MDERDKTVEAKVKFIIKIGFPENNFYAFKEQLNKQLLEDGFNYFEPFKSFIEKRLEKLRDSGTFFKIVSYSENKGSLIIAFTLMAFHSIMKYKEFHDNLEVLRTDLDTFLKYIFDKEPVIIGYNSIHFPSARGRSDSPSRTVFYYYLLYRESYPYLSPFIYYTSWKHLMRMRSMIKCG